MGWSLTGILGAVGKAVGDTAQDWAKRGIIEDERIRSEERSTARAKEMADYQDELLANREARKEELAEKKAGKERESLAENNQIIEREARDQGIKPGTQEFFKFGAQFALDSGRPELAKHYSEQWDKLRDDDWKREQAALSRANSAAIRGAAGGAKESEMSRKQQELDMKYIEKIGTIKKTMPDPDNPGKTLRYEDDSAVPVLMEIYRNNGGNMSLVSASVAGGQQMLRDNPKLDLATATGTYYQWKMDTARTDALRDSGKVPVNDFGQRSSNAGFDASIPSVPLLSTGTESQFRNPLPSTPAEKLSAASSRRSGERKTGATDPALKLLFGGPQRDIKTKN